MTKASIIVTCKGRLEQLKHTVPHHISNAPDFPWELIVVDYGCPDGTAQWVKCLKHPNITAIEVLSNVEYFNLSRARNIGAVHAGGKFLAFCDADVYPNGPWLQTIVEATDAPGVSMCRPKWKRGGCGICCIPAATFKEIRGFDESFEGWGWEDIDLKSRADKAGKVVDYPASLFKVMKHKRAESVQYYKDQRVKGNIPVTNGINKKKARNRKGLPNPDGYGQGDVRIWL